MAEKNKKDIKKTRKPIPSLNESAQGLLDAPTAKARKPIPSLAEATDVAGSIDPYLSRNEFKEGFYEQLSRRATNAETMYGKGTKREFESPIVDPDTSMMQNMADGGSVRGQKAIQVKKKPFKGVF